MKKIIKFFYIWLALLFPFFISRIGQLSAGETLVSAHDILYQVETNYSLFKTYQDNGSLTTSTHTANFETFYIRPNFFLFNWVVHRNIVIPKSLPKNLKKTLKNTFKSKYYAIWSNDSGAYSHYRYRSELNDGLEKEENLRMAVAGATGISSRAAYNVPGLMIKSICGWKITNLKNLNLSEDEIVNGSNCFHITGEHPSDNHKNYELWVDKNNYFVRKTNQTSPLGETVTIYEKILINEEIQTSIFNFEEKIEEVTIKPKKKGILKRISLKIDYLLAYIRSINIEPRHEKFDFKTITKVKTKDYKDAIFESHVRWVIVDPIQYKQKLGSPKQSQSRLNNIIFGALNYALAFRISEKSIGNEVEKEKIDIIILKCNETLKKYKYGIEFIELKSKYLSISEPDDK